jgi:hypothetical protein
MIPLAKSEESSWKGCYTAALFQDDVTKIPMLIARAESEIVARARMLFESPHDHAREMRALDNALRMLQILKKCVKPRQQTEQPAPIPSSQLDSAHAVGLSSQPS